MPAQVPVDLDAVEERLTPRFTARSLTALALAVTAGFAAARITQPLPDSVRAAVCAPTAAMAWAVVGGRWQGASLAEWARRVVRFALTPRRLAPPPSWPASRSEQAQ